MATYAIGDVQGCFDPLQALLDIVSFNPAHDRLWFVGDLVNRGPQSLAVLRYIKSLGDVATVVLGNHDLHLILLAEGFGRANKEDTLGEILTAPDREVLLAWLRAQPLFHHEGAWAMVHAGLLPPWTAAQAKALSDEVSVALTASRYREFLAHMWGSEPTAWRDDLVGWDRLRVVVNAMTRMRYVTSTGAMALRERGAKSPPGQGPAGCVPWFAAQGRASAVKVKPRQLAAEDDGRRHGMAYGGAQGKASVTGHDENNDPFPSIVCGHWSALGFHAQDDVVAIDTGCLWGGALTALRLEDRQVFSLPCAQQVQPAGWD